MDIVRIIKIQFVQCNSMYYNVSKVFRSVKNSSRLQNEWVSR